MLPIPNELVMEMFGLLHQRDKLQCMLVCQQWKELIELSCLFQTVCIYSTDGLEKFIKRLSTKPELGVKVERLIIDYLTEDDINLNSLLVLLPNLQDFLLIAPEAEQEIDEGIVYPWHRCIRQITECAVKTVTHRLLSTSPCPKLTTLSITDNFYDIIPILKNAPALEHLDICFGNLRFSDLEFIHSSLPLLQSLNMSIFSLDVIDFNPHHIRPAVCMTECNFTNVRMLANDIDQNEIKFLKYITMKYPNLSRLEYAYNARDANEASRDFDALNRNGWLPLFKRLAPKLKGICIGGGSQPMDLCKMLDDAQCKLDCLKLDCAMPLAKITQLTRSNQVQYIRTLKLDYINTTTFTWLRGFVVLEKLKLAWRHGSSRSTITLNKLLHMCPKVKSVSLDFANMDFNLDDHTVFDKLESFSIRATEITSDLGYFISNYLPNLHSLKLERCDLEDLVLDISTINLRRFEINSMFRNDDWGLLVITRNGDNDAKEEEEEKRYWYPMDMGRSYLAFYRQGYGFDTTIDPRIDSVPADQIDRPPFFTLICKSFQDFLFMDD